MNEAELLNELRDLFPERPDLHALACRTDRHSRKELSVTMTHCLRQSVAILRSQLRNDSVMMNTILVSLRHRVGASFGFRSLIDAISSAHLWDPSSRVREHAAAIPEVLEELQACGLAYPNSARQVDLVCFVLRIVQVAEVSTQRHYSPAQLA